MWLSKCRCASMSEFIPDQCFTFIINKEMIESKCYFSSRCVRDVISVQQANGASWHTCRVAWLATAWLECYYLPTHWWTNEFSPPSRESGFYCFCLLLDVTAVHLQRVLASHWLLYRIQWWHRQLKPICAFKGVHTKTNMSKIDLQLSSKGGFNLSWKTSFYVVCNGSALL